MANDNPVLGHDRNGREVRKGDRVRCGCGESSCVVCLQREHHTIGGLVVSVTDGGTLEGPCFQFTDNFGIPSKFAELVAAPASPPAEKGPVDADGRAYAVGDEIRHHTDANWTARVCSISPLRAHDMVFKGAFDLASKCWRIIHRATDTASPIPPETPVAAPGETEERKLARARITPQQARAEVAAWLAPIKEVFKPFPRATLVADRTNDGRPYALAEFPNTVVKGRIWSVDDARARVREWVVEVGEMEARR